MIRKTITIVNKLGLHARAASVFAKTANAFEAKIEVTSSKRHADGKSIMAVMMLEASHGTDLSITIDGPDETDAMNALVELIKDRFGESE